MTATRLMIAVIPVLLVTGCRSSDDRLTRLMQQQAATHQEMTRLNREVAAGMTQLTQENAAFRKEALAVQQRLHQQQTDLLRKQERLDAERRQLLQRDPLIARAITHVGITLACLLPLGLCRHLLQRSPAWDHDPLVHDLLLEDITSESPVLITPRRIPAPSTGAPEPPRLTATDRAAS